MYKGETIGIQPFTNRITFAIIPTVGYAYKDSNGIAYRVPRHVEGLDDRAAGSPTASNVLWSSKTYPFQMMSSKSIWHGCVDQGCSYT